MNRADLPRRSRAAIRSAAKNESARTILIAFVANVVDAVAKLVVGLLAGSAALLAEAVHSFADSVNEVLLGTALRRSQVPGDIQHPLGHGRERFLWAFIAAISSFLIGGLVSVVLAIRELRNVGDPEHGIAAWLVLGVSFMANGASWRQSMRQAQREAREHGKTTWHYLSRTSDPTLRAVVVEDTVALVGLGLAAVGLLLSDLVGNSTPDGIAALIIGVLLAVTAIGLARPLADYLVGRSLPVEQLQQLRAIVAASSAVEQVLTVRAVYTGPEEVVVVARIHPAPNLAIDQLTMAMDDLDTAMRATLPEVADVYIDVTSYNLETLPIENFPPLEPQRER
jgi:cation diffusion facilitator family transporter